MDQFETDVMDDLMYEAAEGPARPNNMDALEDEYDEFEEGDEGDDEFLGRILGGAGRLLGGALGGGGRARRGRAGAGGGGGGGGPGGALGGLLGGLGGLLGADEADEWDDEFDAGDDYDAADEDYADDDSVDAVDDLVADALGADDSDEFLRRLGGIARRIGRGVGSVARTVAPIASMIPLPQAQLIGRVAGMAGRLLADGADEFEAVDELAEGLDEADVDAAAPVIAGLAIRRVVPNIARLPRPQRRRLVRGVAQATRTAVRRAGPQAARVVPRVVRTVQRAVRARRVPPRALPAVVRRVTTQVVNRPAAVRRLARPLVPAARRATPRGSVATVARRVGGAAATPATCPTCNHARRHIHLRGPVTITIRR